MQKKQQIRSFEGDFYYFDIIWSSTNPNSTFEIRATNADSGATSTVTNNETVKSLILDGKKPDDGMKTAVWSCNAVDAQKYADRSIGLFENETYMQQLEDAMNDDYASGHWVSEDEFEGENLAFDEDADIDDDDFLFDAPGIEEDFF